MKRWILIVCACGGTARPVPPQLENDPAPPPIVVEWKVAQGQGNLVDVTLVVDGTPISVGALEAATQYEAGTPATCALRAAGPRRTELVCGEGDAYAAELGERELVIRHVVADRRDVVKRVPVSGDALAVKMLALPLDDR